MDKGYLAIALRKGLLNPASITLIAMLIMVFWVISNANGDPLALARIGTRFIESDPNGTEGYDGQFVYYIARELVPLKVEPLLDVPAYRYQRILMPIIGRLLALGSLPALPWSLALTAILAQTAGTWVVSELLVGWGVSRWYALPYGLWVGFMLAVRLDLPEPLAYGLVAGALLAGKRNRNYLSWILYGLALFAKEVTILFVLAAAGSYLWKRQWREVTGLGVFAFLPFILFQIYLWAVFGKPGIGTGGEMATAVEFIPFMGLFRIGIFSETYLIAMLVVFVPALIVPTIWGLWVSVKRMVSGDLSVVVLALFLNSLLIVFLPFSTFRETGGLLRVSCGLVMAVILFAGRLRIVRVLNYSYFWLVLNVFLLKS